MRGVSRAHSLARALSRARGGASRARSTSRRVPCSASSAPPRRHPRGARFASSTRVASPEAGFQRSTGPSSRASPRARASRRVAAGGTKNGAFKNGDARRPDDDRARRNGRHPPRTAPLTADDTPRDDPVPGDDPDPDGDDDDASASPSVPDRERVPHYAALKFERDAADAKLRAETRARVAAERLPRELLLPSPSSDTNARRESRSLGRWPALRETDWEFNEVSAMARGALTPLVAPPWRVMLLSDGSVTRHLQLLTDAKVKVDVLRQQLLRSRDLVGDPAVPDDVLAKLFPGSLAPIAATEDTSRRGGPRLLDAKREISSFRAVSDGVLHREVDLCDGTDGAPLVYASSWWTVEAARKFGILKTDGGATERAVWMHLSDARTELYREVRRVYRGESTELERAWGVPGPFWARHYVFWAGEHPLCVIYEVFSPRLERFLGECDAADAVANAGRAAAR